MASLSSVGETTLVAFLGAKEFPQSAFEPSPAFEAAATGMLKYFLSPEGFGYLKRIISGCLTTSSILWAQSIASTSLSPDARKLSERRESRSPI